MECHSCRTHSVIPTAVEGSQPVASGPFDTPKVIAITFSQTIKKATSFEAALSILVADRTGLEPATSGVTGRHSNQLNYRSVKAFSLWWVVQGLNL